jgi:2-octaprenyl-6-methoxyphenol hydroxylase
MTNPLSLAVVGAGPVGLSLALEAAALLPEARITLYDARRLEHDVAADPRTIALSLGSVQSLERLGVWRAIEPASAPITAVHVSQQQPALLASVLGRPQPELLLRAAECGVERFGAVAGYGALVAPLQSAWLDAVALEPQRLATRFGTAVAALKPLGGAGEPPGVEVDAGIVERHDLAVVAEGGVFSTQARKALSLDYRQTAWVGQVTLEGGEDPGCAYERFTSQGPAALLPLPTAAPDDDAAADGAPGAGAMRARFAEPAAHAADPVGRSAEPTAHAAGKPAARAASRRRAALVWCVDAGDDPVAPLADVQRIALLNHVFPPRAGRVVGLEPLKAFPLGLNAERTLVDGRRVRIGNAAQTLHPVAGQGLNLGLRDAHALVAALRRATAPGRGTPADLDAALRRVEWQRAPDRWTLIAVTDFLARSFTWRLPGAAGARGAGLAALQALAPAKRLLARQMMFGWR